MSNAPFRVIAADHTGITVTNIERSLAFWRDVLGFELSHRAHHAGDLASKVTGVPGAEILIAVLKAPGHKIELLEYLAPADRKQISATSLRLAPGIRFTLLDAVWTGPDRSVCREDVVGHPENKDVMLRRMALATKKVDVLGRFFGGQGTVNVPCWSPDGTRIAFVTYQLVP